MEQKTVRKLEHELDEAIAGVIARMGLNPTSTVVVQPAVFSCFFGHDFVVSPWVVVQVWL